MKAKDVYGSSEIGGMQRFFNPMWDKWAEEDGVDYRPRNQRVFETGSGGGDTVSCLKELGNFVVGSDISEIAVEKLASHADEAVLLDISEDKLMSSDNSFDAVFCLDVLEHISNPYQALTELKRLCVPDGYVHISIPNLVQQGGYGKNKHSVVYPGLFDVGYFRVFLKQMYLKIVYENEWEHPFTFTLVDREWKPAKHHYFVCQNILTKHDILEVVAGDYNENRIYDFTSEEEREFRIVLAWGPQDNEKWWNHVIMQVATEWPDRQLERLNVLEWDKDFGDLSMVDAAIIVSHGNKKAQEMVDFYVEKDIEVMIVAGG